MQRNGNSISDFRVKTYGQTEGYLYVMQTV